MQQVSFCPSQLLALPARNLVVRSTNTMTDLSPAAQAVMDAAKTGLDGYIELLPPTWKSSIAAALRAVATCWQMDTEFIDGVEYVRTDTLLAIAAELEGAQ